MTRLEAMEVYKDISSKFKNTQSIQWKMNLSIWTLFTLAIFYKSKMSLPSCSALCVERGCLVEMLIGMVVVLIHSYFCYKVQKSLGSDKAVKDSIAEQLNATLDDKTNILVDLSAKSSTSPLPWIGIQVSITIILAFVFCISA